MAENRRGALRFAISFDDKYAVLSRAVFLPPAGAYVELAGEEVLVRMSWAFQCRFARDRVASVSEVHRRPLARGVHGWGGKWLVNGSGDGILCITFRPPARAWVVGWPVRLRELLVSVEEPQELAQALTARRVEGGRPTRGRS